MVTFANLAGFWALLGIPVILLIHFLQRQSQVQVVSTLFLLEAIDRESVQGQKLDRIRNSIPLWLQLLAVLLLTWILIQPRWTRPNSVQKIALILDSSASMRAFKEPVLAALEKEIPLLSRGAKTVELIAMGSHIDGEPLYNGTSVVDLKKSLEDWTPFRPAHDPGPALRVGRSLAGTKGVVLFITDHPVDQPGYDSRVLAVGESVPNVGFSGVDVDTSVSPPVWQAMVKNYGTTPQTREWFLQAGQQRTETRTLEMKAGETRTLQGRFPTGTKGVTLHLVPDLFDQDDRAPIVIPEPKALAVAKVGAPSLDKLMKEMIDSFENTIPPSDDNGLDLVLATYDPLSPTKAEPVSIVLLAQPTPGRNFLKGSIVAANHSLVQGLNWQGLIARSSPGMPVGPEDTVLLWQGRRALIFLRENSEQRQLVYNFDVPSSNVENQPAFIVLAHRFVESIRDSKIAPSASNFELNQSIPISFHRGDEAPPLEMIYDGKKTVIPLNQVRSLRAPAEPGFFEIRQSGETLITGAAQFVDTREADFSEAGSFDDLEGVKTTSVTEHTQEDDVWQIWTLLILVVLLLSWYFINRKAPRLEATA